MQDYDQGYAQFAQWLNGYLQEILAGRERNPFGPPPGYGQTPNPWPNGNQRMVRDLTGYAHQQFGNRTPGAPAPQGWAGHAQGHMNNAMGALPQNQGTMPRPEVPRNWPPPFQHGPPPGYGQNPNPWANRNQSMAHDVTGYAQQQFGNRTPGAPAPQGWADNAARARNSAMNTLGRYDPNGPPIQFFD